MPKTRVALVLFLLAVTGLAVWQFQSAWAARASLAAGKLQLENARSEMRALRSSSDRLGRDAELLKRAIAEATLRASLPKDLDTPEQAQKRIRILDAWLALRNAAMYRKLGFSPGQISQYENLAVDHFLRMQDIIATAQAENIPVKDPAIAALIKDENQQYRQEQTAALGAPVTQEIQQFQRTAGMRTIANSVAGDTYYSNTPLSANQADQVTQILANNSAAYQKGNSASFNDINMPTALAQAQGVLTDTQLAALKNLYDGVIAGNKVSSLITTLMQGSSPPSPAQNR